jgi:hypothetical protein
VPDPSCLARDRVEEVQAPVDGGDRDQKFGEPSTELREATPGHDLSVSFHFQGVVPRRRASSNLKIRSFSAAELPSPGSGRFCRQ